MICIKTQYFAITALSLEKTFWALIRTLTHLTVTVVHILILGIHSFSDTLFQLRVCVFLSFMYTL